MANTINNEWKKYRDAVYPEGISGTQSRECHQAFFAGALTMYSLMSEASALPEDEAVKQCGRLHLEVLATSQGIADVMKARN